MRTEFEQAQRFIELITGSQNTKVTFQTYDDDQSRTKEQKRGWLIKVIHGEIKEHFLELTNLNLKGAGIYLTVNTTDLCGRTAKNIRDIRAFFSDDDSGSGKIILPNSFTVQSKRGLHSYLVLDKPAAVECFKPIQKRIAKTLGTDKSINDPSRVMRLPGFYHMKNPKEPFLVKIGVINNEEI